MTAILASLMIATNAPAAAVVSTCRGMVPENVRLEGRIVLRNRKGIVQIEHDYRFERHAGKTTLAIDGRPFEPPAVVSEPLLGTDVTWSDLTLEYLWWDDASFDSEREGESVNGQVCTVVNMRKGDRTVRLWVDRKTGALMQAEEIVAGKSVRRLWGNRLKKFGERWMVNRMEVERLGSGYRTMITVEKLDDESAQENR